MDILCNGSCVWYFPLHQGYCSRNILVPVLSRMNLCSEVGQWGLSGHTAKGVFGPWGPVGKLLVLIYAGIRHASEQCAGLPQAVMVMQEVRHILYSLCRRDTSSPQQTSEWNRMENGRCMPDVFKSNVFHSLHSIILHYWMWSELTLNIDLSTVYIKFFLS